MGNGKRGGDGGGELGWAHVYLHLLIVTFIDVVPAPFDYCREGSEDEEEYFGRGITRTARPSASVMLSCILAAHHEAAGESSSPITPNYPGSN